MLKSNFNISRQLEISRVTCILGASKQNIGIFDYSLYLICNDNEYFLLIIENESIDCQHCCSVLSDLHLQLKYIQTENNQ